MRAFLVRIAEAVSFCLLIPFFIWAHLPLPEYSRFTAPSQVLALIPGFTGVLLRRVWYRHTLKRCGEKLIVDWMAVIRTSESEVGNHCTIGVGSWVGWVKLGDDVMTGSHVVLLSGGRQHAFDNVDQLTRIQPGAKEQLIVQHNVWIGTGSIVMAEVSSGTVIGAGSVVTKTWPSDSVLAGVPAKVLHERGGARPESPSQWVR